jgi:hypothetical protein
LQIDCDVHLLLTSRKEYDIETTLQASVTVIVSMEDKLVDSDIEIHVEHCLHEDPKLCKWDEKIKQEIVTELVSGAKGMYDILRRSK